MDKAELLEIEEQAQESCRRAQARPGGPRLIARELKEALRFLRGAYESVREKEEPTGWEAWLAENYYVLESHGGQALRDLRAFFREGAGLELVYRPLFEVFCERAAPLEQEAAEAALRGINRARELGERQFDFVYVALKCAFTALAARACKNEGEEALVHAVVSLNQRLYELDFDRLAARCSATEAILSQDPDGTYPRMADASRRHYRQVAARIGRMTGAPESQVAQDVLLCAQNAQDPRMRHVGFYLLGHDPQRRAARRRGKIALAAMWLLPLAACLLLWEGVGGWAVLLYPLLVEITRVLAMRHALRRTPPAHLPRMDEDQPKPKTVVAVSTLLPSASRVDRLRARLEQLYFANRSENLFFCVLADFREERRPYNPQDDINLDAAAQVVEQLNRDYGGRFLLFARRRVYSGTQDAYAGWERKRGAIIELLRFIKGGETSLCRFAGEREWLAGARYLLALDADTELTFGAADRLVQTAEHPLNRPVIGEENRVRAGYGILVPRMGVGLEAAKQTCFTRVQAGAGGVSTYERPCFDFYQDTFGKTVFCGKGLIDIDAFYTVLNRRFPEEKVLSHDILEGAYLRAGLVSDVELLESIPASAVSWFARLHRWLRGDWQNLPFLRKNLSVGDIKRPNPIGGLAKYQLFDNLRRSLTPVLALLAVLCMGFASRFPALLLGTAALLALVLPELLDGCSVLLRGGWQACARRYFSRALSRFRELAARGGLALVMAAQQAVVSADAAARSLWRMNVTKKRLLEWTTAAQGEAHKLTMGEVVRRSWISELLGLLLLVFCPYLLGKLFGAAFFLYAPLAVHTARRAPEPQQLPARAQREQIISWCAQMFRYYEDYAGKENNYLPPDNVQFSPREAVARRTSPTNIGMMLLSYLAARDFHFIDSAGLFLRVSRTLDTVESLETCHGNLYNWYDTGDLRVLPDFFVSAVDSGNFLCSLTALKEGLREYVPEQPELGEVVARIERLLEQADLRVFYSPARKLFSIGLDRDGNQSGSHYDFLMSEARATSYYAVATRQAPARHWRALNRSMSRTGCYAGPVSWTGTMFEYLMPHLFLPVYGGSLLGEAARYALYCQKRRAGAAGTPWGISESGYFAFDGSFNYQYKAHGVQALGVKRGLDRECVISPYSTFLALPLALEASMENLSRLESMGLTGCYGFYEAVDFTPERCGGAQFAVVRSYMAHHIGMSMVACANALLDNVMQKRFMRDRSMRSAREFLQEQISKDTVVYKRMKEQETQRQRPPKPPAATVPADTLRPCACALLENGGLCQLSANNGVGWLRYGEVEVTRRPEDPSGHGQGILAVARMCGETICATAAPLFQHGVERGCTMEPDGVSYRAKKGTAELEQRFTMDRALPVERCTLTLRNRSEIKAVADVLFYLEPVLMRGNEYEAHPAFSKLFLLGERDHADQAVYFTRRHRDGSEGLWLAVGFDRPYDYACALRREEVTPYPEGMESLLRFDTLPFTGQSATPDGCCALRLSVLVPAKGETLVNLLLSVGATKAECAGHLADARGRGLLPARAGLMDGTLTAKIGGELLPALLFGGGCGRSAQARAENTRGQDALWTLGISGDLPVVVYDWTENPDAACLAAYCGFWQLMGRLNLPFDLCVLAEEAPSMPLPEGVRRINPKEAAPELLTALLAAACRLSGSLPAPARGGFAPEELSPVKPAAIPGGDRFDVVGGAYVDGRFYVDRVTPLPFSHVLANASFGCLLSDAGLGCTWWQNARECRITPWRNDIASGCDGERLLLRAQGQVYDLCRGARASFSASDARYESLAGQVRAEIRVTVGKAGRKDIELSLENQGDAELEIACMYQLEPVLSVTRRAAQYLQFSTEEGCLVLHNPYNMQVDCFAAVAVPGMHPSFTNNREAVLAGDWSAVELIPNNDPIAGTVVRKKLPPHRRERIRFILTAASTRRGALALARLPEAEPSATVPRLEISTPDEPLNRFFNGFAAHQVVAGRIMGRCAFYQCSGAYGFRDQLQDAGACLLIDPRLSKAQILRCCEAQFPQGDVLHWWHPLPSGTRGVRTRFSDDLLWLPYIVADYLEATGDRGLLDIQARYCKGEPLAENEQERYFEVQPDELRESVFDHCVRAIDHAFQLGDKGIPLIGCGDWNDGFSNVGVQGKGQSVWLGMFLAMVFDRFAPLCEERGDHYRASLYRGNALLLRQNIDQNCWDGRWYLRAFYDDGATMGSHLDDACQIDLLPQSFSVLAELPDEERVNLALDSALERLADEKNKLVKLFTPPFDRSAHNPGYIMAYPSGIRENGGQYTHAAVWFAMALLRLGRAEEGWRILDLLNPTSRCTNAQLAQAFKTEPYYLPADIYTHRGAYGHGGWSIYTGAAGWYYRAVAEELLGLRPRGDCLEVRPMLPESWNGYSVTVRMGGGALQIQVRRGEQPAIEVDGAPAQKIPLDGKDHTVLVVF